MARRMLRLLDQLPRLRVEGQRRPRGRWRVGGMLNRMGFLQGMGQGGKAELEG